jgi:hypothetical protein
MADERLQGPETADLVAAERGDDGRRAILDAFILGLFVLTAGAAVLSLTHYFHASYTGAVEDSLLSGIALGSLAVIWWINRRGHTSFATWLCLLLLLLATSLFMDGPLLDRLFIVYALPVVSAAFLLRPDAAFLFAALSAGSYIATWLAGGREPGFNYLSLFIIAGLALVSYLVAAYWREALEVQEEYRRELERDVHERERAEAQLLAREHELEEVADRLRGAVVRMVDAMVAAIELHDPGTAGHQRRVARLSRAIGEELRLPHRTLESLSMAAALHDVGMATVPVLLLTRPGPLTDAEYAVVKQHPDAARPVLELLGPGSMVADIVTEHHERVDGSGYPRGLTGDEIRREARIIAVADTVEAMMSGRPHRPAFGREDTLAALRQGSGALYDPDAVEACLRVFEKGFDFDA